MDRLEQLAVTLDQKNKLMALIDRKKKMNPDGSFILTIEELNSIFNDEKVSTLIG